ncbi:MAG: polymer-forming cytoskeletal protein [Burkholderiales bacterium]|jgi:cytoskeletal protein CcmA (bactofilin family)
MFGEKKRPAPQKRIDCLIGAGTTVRGDIVFAGGLRIDGQVVGNVATADGQAGTLVVSEHAKVDGEIRVSHVVVNGTVHGPVIANDYLELQPKARIVGDVAYKTLEMHVGAVIQGRLNHDLAEPETGSVVELKRAQGA